MMPPARSTMRPSLSPVLAEQFGSLSNPAAHSRDLLGVSAVSKISVAGAGGGATAVGTPHAFDTFRRPVTGADLHGPDLVRAPQRLICDTVTVSVGCMGLSLNFGLLPASGLRCSPA